VRNRPLTPVEEQKVPYTVDGVGLNYFFMARAVFLPMGEVTSDNGSPGQQGAWVSQSYANKCAGHYQHTINMSIWSLDVCGVTATADEIVEDARVEGEGEFIAHGLSEQLVGKRLPVGGDGIVEFGEGPKRGKKDRDGKRGRNFAGASKAVIEAASIRVTRRNR